ncbi:MAG: TRAP transporter substrate-binding protein DctP [Pseudomonadota bacterium]
MLKHFTQRILCPVLAVLALGLTFQAHAQAPKIIKISHQFPPASGDDGDFRDRLVRKFATEVKKRSKGQLKFEIYPASSLVKTMAQISSVRKNALDMTLVPLAYGGGEIPEVNLTLMPTLVTSYEQGLRWKDAPIGRELTRILEERGIKIVTWVWQGGGIASTSKAIVNPEDVKGLKARGGSKEMDLMLKAAGAAITSMPSSEVYNAMQSGVLDAAVTSSTSLISFRLQEFTKHVTTARNKTFWFMFEPLIMSKAAYDALTPEQQKIVTEVGASLEKWGMEESKKDDARLADIYAKAGAKVYDMDEVTFNKWREVAKQSAFKDFEERVRNGKQLLDMALAVK